MSALEKIEAQQKGKEYTDAWAVGEQLKDMLRDEPDLEEILDKDLDQKGMGLEDAARKIKAWADEKHRKQKGNCVCVPPQVAEGIIREFYGLPAAGRKAVKPAADETDAGLPDLASFF